MEREADNELIAVEARRNGRDGKFTRLIAYLDHLYAQNFTGNIRINLTQGRIGRVEKYEEVLK